MVLARADEGGGRSLVWAIGRRLHYRRVNAHTFCESFLGFARSSGYRGNQGPEYGAKYETMSPYQRAVLGIEEEDCPPVAVLPSTHAYAMLEELGFVRREAQAEADEAYEDWKLLASSDAYAVYRAAQDRADAAQDDLAQLVAQLAAPSRR